MRENVLRKFPRVEGEREVGARKQSKRKRREHEKEEPRERETERREGIRMRKTDECSVMLGSSEGLFSCSLFYSAAAVVLVSSSSSCFSLSCLSA